MDNSTKLVKTKKRLMEISRPTGPQPIYEAPAVEPRQSKFEQELEPATDCDTAHQQST